MSRLRAEFRGLRITERGRLVVESVTALALLVGGYVIAVCLWAAA